MDDLSKDLDGAGDLDLKALFAEDAPPAHDAAFVAAVALRTARGRLAIDLVRAALTAGLCALVLWAMGPVLAPAIRPFAALGAAFAPLVLVVGSVLVLIHPRTGVA